MLIDADIIAKLIYAKDKVSAYRIENDAESMGRKMPRQAIAELRNGKRQLENMTVRSAQTLMMVTDKERKSL
ncbi:hypothetical protein [Levilactobacillus brevis]|uniref:hypothetical protein n=1 Tax=Levilactobacillus brevis TaxID=1580 RepID=UPI000B3555BB|nr:hypothetical protein [Levilactobacillus brevis]